MKRAHRLLHVRQKGSYLLEALIAILLFAFGILGLIGLLATSVRATNDARYRTEAANLANGMVADMWTMTAAKMTTEFCAGCTKFTAWQTEVATLLPASGVTVDLTPGLSLQSSTVVVRISWRPPGNSETHNYVMTAQIGKNS